MPKEEERHRAHLRMYVCMCVCDTRRGEGYERTCFRQRRAKEKERRRGGGGDSGSDRVGIEHVLRRSSFSIRVISSLGLPWTPLPSRPDTFSSASSSYTRSTLIPRLLPRCPYAKCIYVLCKASNRRWPRQPDAHCVINTDALVVPLTPQLLL